MKNQVIAETLQSMAGVLNNMQLDILAEVLQNTLNGKVVIADDQGQGEIISNGKYLSLFIAAKQVEGCSNRTLHYYDVMLKGFLETIQKSICLIETEDIRLFLAHYENTRNVSKVTLDNMRRIISSFFSWLEEELYIIKSPARRIHKIRTGKVVKSVFSDEDMEKIRAQCTTYRDEAMVNLLVSTGMRVGELVQLNRGDIDFEKRECIVLGKGNKERVVYFDARTKLTLMSYLESRIDDSQALFISLNRKQTRLSIGAVEHRLRQMGIKIGIDIHPHKFRRTLATKAIDKGMPIEQVQVLLGHAQIETTLRYAMVNQKNVKMAHQKYIS